MSNRLNLKEIERKAYKSTFKDGLKDMQYGLMVICMSFLLYRPEEGYSVLNSILPVCAAFIVNYLYKAAKKHITQPRLGQVRFGEIRSGKKKIKAIVLSFVILFQILLLGVSLLGWINPVFGKIIGGLTKSNNQMDLLIAGIGASIIGFSMTIIAVFEDFLRGYYIALLMSVAVFVMIYSNQPIYPIFIGISIFIPGLVLLLKFLNNYQISQSEETHE
jgi:hypothetical protein